MTMISGVFHLNLNVHDMDHSVAFYRSLGFEIVDDLNVEHPDLGAPLGIAATALRTVFLRLPGDPDGPMLDLVQFLKPPTRGTPYESPRNLGIGRIAFRVGNVSACMKQCIEMGITPVGPVLNFPGPEGSPVDSICFRDPDGIMVQLFGPASA